MTATQTTSPQTTTRARRTTAAPGSELIRRTTCVRRMLRARFPDKEISDSDPLHSIAAGLALMGTQG